MRILSRQAIVATAIRLADADGFDTVTLRRIASELGVHVTSLYNHVPTREAVTDAIVEQLIAEAGVPVGRIGWEEWVRRFVGSICSVARIHPGAFTALGRRPVQGSNALATFESALDAFHRAGLDTADAYAAVKATTLLALGIGTETSLLAQGSTLQTDVDRLPAADFPLVRQVRHLEDPEHAWGFAVDALVSGLRSAIRNARSAARAGAQPGRSRL